MTFVSAGHIILTPTQPDGGGPLEFKESKEARRHKAKITERLKVW